MALMSKMKITSGERLILERGLIVGEELISGERTYIRREAYIRKGSYIWRAIAISYRSYMLHVTFISINMIKADNSLLQIEHNYILS